MIRMMPVGVATFSTGPAWPVSSVTSTLRMPAFGEPRISQAIAPTKGERNSGAMMQTSISGRAGRSVRPAIQASTTPATVASSATRAAISSVCHSVSR